MVVSDLLARVPSLARFKIDRAGGQAPYRQIAQAIHDAVVHGELPAGERLPPERELATALRVSRSTVARALTSLSDTGLLERRVGRGTVVAFDLRNWQAGPTTAIPWGALLTLVPAVDRRPTPPAPNAGRVLAQLAAQQAAAPDRDAGSIILTSSASEATRFLVEALVHERARVIVETPAPVSLLTSLAMRGAELIELPRREDHQSGAIELLLDSAPGAKLAFVRPHNQDSRHDQPRDDLAHMLGLTKRFGLPLIELNDRPSLSLQLEPHDHVIQVQAQQGGEAWISAPQPFARQLHKLARLLGIGTDSPGPSFDEAPANLT